MLRSRTLRSALFLPALSLAAACQGSLDGAHDGEQDLGHAAQGLSQCTAPALNQAALCDNGAGNVTFQVTLPSGQRYVELFVRQNGIQNVAKNIVKSAKAQGNGATTYSFAKSGYANGDRIEYRFYSYLPASPGVFTPGPSEQAWLSYTYGAPAALELDVTKDASLIYSSYGTGPSADKNFGSAPTVDVASYHHDSRGLFGYDIEGLEGAEVTKAELVIPAMWAAAGNVGRFTLAKVNDSQSWQESTVTWLTTPAATLFGEYTVDASTENRLDVTALVADAVAQGETEISFLLEDIQNNLFIDSKEKAGGKPTYLRVEYAD